LLQGQISRVIFFHTKHMEITPNNSSIIVPDQ
jgi:hypothetical protein